MLGRWLIGGVRNYHFGASKLPRIPNEKMLDYEPKSPEKARLISALETLRTTQHEIPCVVGGKEIRTGNVRHQLVPSDHAHKLCTFHLADKSVLEQAIANAVEAKKQWELVPFEDRAAIFLKAADLLSEKYRGEICGASILGQGKTVWQAEIDAAAETIDFLRFNTHYAQEIYSAQPEHHSKAIWNRLEYRPLEGFVTAIAPFNFTAIGANLASAPALMGNVVLFKPADGAMLASWIVYQTLLEAGLPPGVIQFLPCDGPLFSETAVQSREFAGLGFTGSTATFNHLNKLIVNNLENFRQYPRIVGETGGKNFHLAHPSADVDNFVHNTIRSAFEFQGQKCSACSRAYVPSNLWPQVKEQLVFHTNRLKMGQPDDFSSFLSAVIDKKAFERIKGYINLAKSSPEYEILTGGECDDRVGYFVRPTIIVTKNPKATLMKEEIFGPVLTIYVYPENEFEQTMKLVDETPAYGLTGSIFSRDRYAIVSATNTLRNAAGNFYINDKCTGAVVGQQPFGGSRKSGTNDKAGYSSFLLRWVSIRTIKENFLSIQQHGYPYMLPDHEHQGGGF